MKKCNKILGIGLNRAGTTSLNKAFQMMEISSMHRASAVWEKVNLNKAMGWPLLMGFERIKAFSDHPIDWEFKQLDKDYPGSLFIYTQRDLEPWISSKMWLAKEHGTKVTRGILLDQYKSHYEDVMNHFKNRMDVLLEMNIPGGDGWEKLCPFLGKGMMVEPFPNEGARAR